MLSFEIRRQKVVYILDEQTDRRTKPPSKVLVYRYRVHKIYTLPDLAPPPQTKFLGTLGNGTNELKRFEKKKIKDYIFQTPQNNDTYFLWKNI